MKYPIGVQNFTDLCQSGYVTIKDYDSEFDLVTVDFIFRSSLPSSRIRSGHRSLSLYTRHRHTNMPTD